MIISLCRFFIDSRYRQFAQRFVRLLFFGECFIEKLELESFDRTRSFVVVGCDSGRRYRISYGVQQNVYEIDQGGGETKRRKSGQEWKVSR
jgi:hypothetical protein